MQTIFYERMDTKKLRQKILDLAIHGKLVPQDPNDEPASVLLERIRAEKERLIKEGKIKQSKKSAKSSDTPHYENVPEGWCISTIGEVFNLQAGKNISANDIHECSQNFPYACYGGNGIRGYVSDYNRDGKFPIIGRQGALCGNVNFAEGKFYATEHAVVVTCFAGVNIEWARYVLEAMNLNQYATATAQPGLSVATVNEVEFMLPPLNEQCRIAEFIANCFEAIESLTTQTNDLRLTLDKAKSKILDLAIHGKLVTQDANDESASELLKRINPKAVASCDNAHCQYRFPIYWELVKLEDVCEFIRNGVSIRQIKGANGIPITRIETISNGIVDRDRMGYADIIDDTYEKYYLQHGDILMSHINSPIHVGKSALYESIEGEKIIHGMNLLCLRMKTGICPKYMNYLFMSEIFKDEIRPYIKNAVNQASINTRNLGGVYSPIPPYNEQQRIVTKIEELFAVLDEIQKSIEA